MRLIVASRKDEASLNIAEELLRIYDFQKTDVLPIKDSYVHEETEVKLIFIEEEPVNAQNIDQIFKPEIVIFISRHSSKSGLPTLTVHTPGNFGEAKLGGKPRELSISPANAMKTALQELFRWKTELNLNYEVSYECTHHGPTLAVPTMFVELGSSKRQWRDREAAEAVARAAMASATQNGKCRAVLGIGGPHYNMKFTKIAMNEDLAFGHIIPNYALPYIDKYMIKKCIVKTYEKVEMCVLDWKGIRGAFKNDLITNLTDIGLEIRKV